MNKSRKKIAITINLNRCISVFYFDRINKFIKPIREELTKQGFKFSIKGRPKSVHSIWNKMRNQDVPFEQVFDLFAIRIILETTPDKEKADCWQVYSSVTDFYHPNPDRLRD